MYFYLILHLLYRRWNILPGKLHESSPVTVLHLLKDGLLPPNPPVHIAGIVYQGRNLQFCKAGVLLLYVAEGSHRPIISGNRHLACVDICPESLIYVLPGRLVIQNGKGELQKLRILLFKSQQRLYESDNSAFLWYGTG